MASIHKLSARKVAEARQGKYEDGGGLRLVVAPTGSKKWVLRYTFARRRREMGLGSYPGISLAEARSKAAEMRSISYSGVDPLSKKKSEKISIPYFEECAKAYIESQKAGWKNSKHISQWLNTLETYVFPSFGSIPVNQIETEHVLSALKPIWERKTETATRVQGRIANILDYAAAMNYRSQANPARWRGHLDKLLPKPSRIQTVRHHPAMPFSDVPEFLVELKSREGSSPNALLFLIATATRTSEVLGAKWSEIDYNSKSWVIPAERMKAKREHRVPLSELALRVLRDRAKPLENNNFIFVGAKPGRGLSNMAMLKVMRDLGYGVGGVKGNYVPHGFRSSFRDWAGEVSSFPGDVIEMALAHSIKNKVEAAYRRGDLFEKRRALMESWAEFIESFEPPQ